MISIHAAFCTTCQTIQHWQWQPCLSLCVAVYSFCTACQHQHLHAIHVTKKHNNTFLLCSVARRYFADILAISHIILHKNALPPAEKNEISEIYLISTNLFLAWPPQLSWIFFRFFCSLQCVLAIPIKKSSWKIPALMQKNQLKIKQKKHRKSAFWYLGSWRTQHRVIKRVSDDQILFFLEFLILQMFIMLLLFWWMFEHPCGSSVTIRFIYLKIPKNRLKSPAFFDAK